MNILMNKQIMLLGYGVTGKDVLKALLQKSLNLVVVDDNINDTEKEYLTKNNVKYMTGQEAIDTKLAFDIVIKSPGIRYNHPLLQDVDHSKIINDIEIAYFLVKDTETKIVAITGTNGKTSTTSFITALLKSKGYNAFSCGNIGVSPIRVLSENENVDFLVMELSSFQLKAIDAFKADYAFFLNFSPDHLDYHDDLADYFNSKMKIIKNTPVSQKIYLGEKVDFEADMVNVVLPTTDIPERLTTNLKGLSKNNMNVIYQFAKEIGMSNEDVIDALDNHYNGLEHRCEFVTEYEGVSYYNDSKATNVESTKIALEQLENVILLVGGSDKGEDLTRLNQYAENVKYAIAYGANRDQFTLENLSKVETLSEALVKAQSLATEGDVILLSPSSASYDQYKNYEERGRHFKQLVHEYTGE